WSKVSWTAKMLSERNWARTRPSIGSWPRRRAGRNRQRKSRRSSTISAMHSIGPCGSGVMRCSWASSRQRSCLRMFGRRSRRCLI
ncbi:hypothetical protein LTR48_008273, partial [Friedmanniomyces endolithicus]